MGRILLLIGVMSIGGLSAQPPKQPPNVVVILADDLGWADLGCYGSTFYETPNLDRLAANGVKFTQNYATCPVCSPTRASMMTGKYPVKTGVTDWIRGRQDNGNAQPYEKLLARPTAFEIGLQEKTIAELALDKGYRTFFAGKWHLGEEAKYWPDKQGFEQNKGGWSKGSPTGKVNDTTGGYFTPYKNPTLPDGPAGEYLTDRLTNECLQFIDNAKGQPFFMMYALYAVHNPLQAPISLVKKYEEKKKRLGITDKERFAKDEPWMQPEAGWKRRLVQDNAVYAAMIENMDANIGRIMGKLRQRGLDDNTLVIFTSDNGGLSTAEGSPTVNGPLRAGKGWLYEGGLRMPLIMYWKGKITAGLVSDMPVTTADCYPTIASAINKHYKKEPVIDGDDIVKLLAQKNTDRPLFWHYPHYSNQGGRPGSAIRQGDYKLIYNYEDSTVEVFDIVHDIMEKNEISAKNPQRTQQLKKQLMQWLAATHASFPLKNPGYNATAKPVYKGQDE